MNDREFLVWIRDRLVMENGDSTRSIHITRLDKIIDAMPARPVPQYEDVETKIWQILGPNGQKHGVYPDFMPTLSPEEAAKGWQVIEYLSTYRREVKPKVKRREEVRYCGGMGKIGKDYTKIPDNAKVYAEWEE